MLTAYADAELVQRAMRSGSFAFLTKPFEMPVLTANIEMVLAKRASEAQLRTMNRRLDQAARALEQRTDELQRMYSLLHTAFEATADGLLVVDRHGVQVANPRACQMWTISPAFPPDRADQLLQHIAAQLVKPRLFLDAVEDVRERAVPHDGLALALKDGRTVEASFRPQRMNGAVVGCVVSFNDVTDRERTQRDLRESEARYRTLFEDAPIALAISDGDGRPLLANAAMRRLHDAPGGRGAPGESLSGDASCSLFEPATVARLSAQVVDGQQVCREELPMRLPDGRLLDAVVTVRPVTLHGVAAVMWMVEDVTARKRTQRALEMLSTTVVSPARPDDFFPAVAQQVAALLDVEAAGVSMVFRGPHEARVRTVGFCLDGAPLPPLDVELAGTPCEAIMHNAESAFFCDDVVRDFPALPLFRDMQAVGLAGVALRDSRGRKIGSLFIISRRPIAQPAHVESMLRLFAVRTAGEMERQLEQHRFHDLFEFSLDAILMVNERGQIVRANRQAQTQFGYTHDELMALTVESLLPEADRAAHIGLRRAFFDAASSRLMGATGQPVMVRRKDGSQFAADIGLSPLRSADGLLMAVDVRDVSERMRHEEQRRSLEAQLRHAQKMEAIGTLAGGIAHDFNNLLAAMVANLELARGDVPGDHAAVESLDAIGVAADRARQLVRQILAFSRRNPPHRVVVTSASLVHEVVRLLRATVPKGVAIHIHIEPETPDVFVDPTQVHQVLMNLATNAWHAMTRGAGDITIAVEPSTLTAAEPQTGQPPPGPYARFVVSDNGKGMSPEIIERIFEPFFTTKQVGRGSGLGLSVVHGIVTDHGGMVTVESEVGRGTRVAVYLPASRVPVEHRESTPESDRIGSGRVAFLDDEIAMAVTAQRLLRRLGFTPTVYDRPADLLEAVHEDPARFDLVITDCNMPGMSGLDVARDLAAVRPGLPVILISGFADRTEEELQAAGIQFRLDKPFTMQELNRTVQRALSTAGASSAAH